jgi:outer membrane protein assembly factor BamB
MRKRWLVALALLVCAVAGVAVAGVVVWQDRQPPGSIVGSPSVEFVTTDAPGAATTPRPKKVVREIPWPNYKFDNARTNFASDFSHRPPFRQLWVRRAYSVLEFTPVIAYGRLYVENLRGKVFAINGRTGKVAWRKDLGRCTAASPAVGGGIVYVPLMDPYPCDPPDRSAPGFIVALDADTGKELWRFRAGVVETSPLLVDGLLYFGSWDRKMYALDVKTHKVKWTFPTGDELKAGPAYHKGTLYFASYDGRVYAVDARTGKQRWSGAGEANFYSTPAVAYGRVYIGNTDGRVYAFGAKSGRLLWARSTGSYVYSGPAVWNETVYVGSHSNRLFALNAGTGAVRWSFDLGDVVAGSPTVMAGIVYASTRGRTVALEARTGKPIWRFSDGRYTPVIADDERVYLVGWTRIYGLKPRG